MSNDNNQVSTLTTPPGQTNYKAGAEIVNDLFKQLAGCYTAWRQAFRNDAELKMAKQQWTVAMIEAGINTEEQIQRGLSRARQDTNPYLPSVGQFIEWCRPDPNALPLYRSDPKLLDNPSKPETVEKNINQMKEALKR